MSLSKKRRLRAARRLPLVRRPFRRLSSRSRRLSIDGSLLGFSTTRVLATVIALLLPIISLLPTRTMAAAVPSSGEACTSLSANAPGFDRSAQDRWLDRRRLRLAAGRKGGTRSKAEIEREQRELLAKVVGEVDALAAEFHELLPRAKAKRTGAIYARYSSSRQSSVPAQVRTLLEIAVREGTFIPRELFFFDLAVRGYRDSRPGLNALRAAATAKKFHTLLVFGTSRLFRKAHRAVRFVEEEIVERQMRCYFIQQNIDTASNKDWRLHLMIQAAVDENGTSMYAENIRAAHLGMFLRQIVSGSLPLGYHGVPIEGGGLTKRGRPRCRIAIDAETRSYVEKIFQWYVVDGLAIDTIGRLLNDDPDAPSPPKSGHGMWTHASVRGVLTNSRYRGFWEYGKTQACYQSKADYVRQVERDAPLQAAYFDELRIIDDSTWYQAQTRLLEERRNSGRKATKTDPRLRPKLLNGMLWCPEHNRPLQTGGSGNKAMVCKLCQATMRDNRPLYTQLDRRLALKLTLEKLAELVRGDEELVGYVVEACRAEAEARQRPDPERLARLKAQEAKKTLAIQANRRNPGETEADQKESDDLVRELRGERTKLREQMALLEAADHRKVTLPAEREVRDLVKELGKVLQSAALGEEPDDPRAVRRMIQTLTGGKIFLYQQGERRPKRGWLQGRISVRLFPYLLEQLTGEPAVMVEQCIEVVIDYREPPPENVKSERARELYDQDVLNVEIAAELKCSKAQVTKLLKLAAAQRGEPFEDGRSRRSRLARKHQNPTQSERNLPEVRRLMDEGKLLAEISAALRIDGTTMTKLYNQVRAERGLPPLDGRSRRKQLPRKSRPKQDPPHASPHDPEHD